MVDTKRAVASDSDAIPLPSPPLLTETPTKGRWVILFLLAMMYLICYMDRSNFSVAAPEISKSFGLDKTAMGFLLGIFTWGYALGQVPAGWMGDRFGPRKVLTIIMVWRAIAITLTGAAVGMASLVTARAFLGLGEAGAFPVASRGMQVWFKKSERGRCQGTTHLFSRLAVVITPFVAGPIMVSLGWRWVFYIFGSVGVVWALIFVLYYRNRPEEHHSVNRAELAEIRGLNPDGTIKTLSTARQKTPWGTILGSPNMWFIALGYCCFFFGTNFYLTWYPTYLREYRHMSLMQLGIFGSVPLIAGMCGDLVGGAMSDFFVRKTGSAKLGRRLVAAPGFILAGLFIVPAAMTTTPWISIALLSLSFFCLEWVIGPAWAVPMDVGGAFSGTVTGVMNMMGAFAASLTAVIYGALFNRNYWVAPFVVSAGVMFLGALIWIFLIDPEKSVVDRPGATV